MARILLVDDRVTDRTLLHTSLGVSGHQVDEAIDGPVAVAKTLAHPYDVLLIDEGCADMRFTQLIDELHEIPGNEHTPVITLIGPDCGSTTRVPDSVVARLRWPFTGDELRDAVARALEAGQQRRVRLPDGEESMQSALELQAVARDS